jgi:hypothetical protein
MSRQIPAVLPSSPHIASPEHALLAVVSAHAEQVVSEEFRPQYCSSEDPDTEVAVRLLRNGREQPAEASLRQYDPTSTALAPPVYCIGTQ